MTLSFGKRARSLQLAAEEDAEAWYNHGICQYNLGLLADSNLSYTRALDLAGGNRVRSMIPPTAWAGFTCHCIYDSSLCRIFACESRRIFSLIGPSLNKRLETCWPRWLTAMWRLS